MIAERKDMAEICRRLRAEHRKIVFTNGCFDIIHTGHVTYLEKARALGDLLIIGLNTDASVKRLKGPNRPINSQEDRAIVLNALKSVDYVTFFDEDTPLELIGELMPDVLVKGGDYKIEDIVGADLVMNNGGRVQTIPFVEGKSTTSIITKMQAC